MAQPANQNVAPNTIAATIAWRTLAAVTGSAPIQTNASVPRPATTAPRVSIVAATPSPIGSPRRPRTNTVVADAAKASITRAITANAAW